MPFLALAAALSLPLMAAQADLILHNGKILTVDAEFSIREAVAIQGNRFAAVGRSKEILEKFRGPRTVVIDLGGRTVLPGLIDAHVHALESGLSELRGPLPPLDSIAAIQDYIRARVRVTPKGQWIVVPRTLPPRLKEMRMPHARRPRRRARSSGGLRRQLRLEREHAGAQDQRHHPLDAGPARRRDCQGARTASPTAFSATPPTC